jgi:hypothetical protein
MLTQTGHCTVSSAFLPRLDSDTDFKNFEIKPAYDPVCRASFSDFIKS